MGTALTERRSTRSPGSRRGRCSARTPIARARSRRRAGSRRCVAITRRVARRARSSSGSSGSRRSRTRRTSCSASGVEAMRQLLDAAVPIERFEVERALEQSDASTDEMLAAAAQTIAPMPASVLRAELVKLVADRLGLGEQLVNEVLRAPVPVGQPQGAATAAGQDGGWGERGGRQWDKPRQGGGQQPWNGSRHGGGGRDRFRPDDAARARRPADRARQARAERARVPRVLPRAARRGRAAARRGRPRGLLLRARDPPGRRLPARPPARAGGQPARRRRGARPARRRARDPRRRARGHARQARARGAATRPAPPRAPHLERPPLGRYERRRSPRDRAPAGARRDPPQA